MIFQGLCTALITPFNDGKIDFDAFSRLVNYQLEGGVNALLFLGTTGEPATMSAAEKEEVIRFAVKNVKGKVPVIIGAGANCTAAAAESAKKAEALGADAVLTVTPYYNKCTQEGVVAHYRAVCQSVGIPVMSYNVPGRTGVNILPDTALKLCEIKNMAAIKEASGNVAQISETARLTDGKIDLYSGDDGLALPIFSLGALGLVSVVSNVAPELTSRLCRSYSEGDIVACRQTQFKLAPLISALFSEVSPIGAKYACSKLGICKNELRLPLTPATCAAREKIDAAMSALGLD